MFAFLQTKSRTFSVKERALYPFQPILINIADEQHTCLRNELSMAAANECLQFLSVAEAMDALAVHHATREHHPQYLFFITLERVDCIADLTRLSKSFLESPIVVVNHLPAEASTLMEIIAGGAFRFLKTPLHRLEVEQALLDIAMHFGQRHKSQHVIAVAGVQGGVGATTLAINLAYTMAQSCKRETILLEVPPQFSAISSLLDIVPKHTIEELLSIPSDIDAYAMRAALHPFCDRLSVLVTEQQLPALTQAHCQRIPEVVTCASSLAEAVILDLPAGNVDVLETVASHLSGLLLVADQSIVNLQIAKEYMRRFAKFDPKIIVNRFDSTNLGLTVIQHFLGTDCIECLENEESAMRYTVGHAQPLLLAQPKCKMNQQILELASSLLHDPSPIEVSRKSSHDLLHSALDVVTSGFSHLGLASGQP